MNACAIHALALAAFLALLAFPAQARPSHDRNGHTQTSPSVEPLLPTSGPWPERDLYRRFRAPTEPRYPYVDDGGDPLDGGHYDLPRMYVG